jgi:hypothetical protein
MLLPEPRVRASLSVSVRPAALPLGQAFQNVLAPLCAASSVHLSERPALAMLAQALAARPHDARETGHVLCSTNVPPICWASHGPALPSPLTGANKSDNPNGISDRSNRDVLPLFIGLS